MGVRVLLALPYLNMATNIWKEMQDLKLLLFIHLSTTFNTCPISLVDGGNSKEKRGGHTHTQTSYSIIILEVYPSMSRTCLVYVSRRRGRTTRPSSLQTSCTLSASTPGMKKL